MSYAPEWLKRVVADLRDYAAELLEVGLAEAGYAVAARGHSPVQSTLDAIGAYCTHVPDLLSELEAGDGQTIAELVYSPTPRMALRSNRPDDYALVGGRMIPFRWLRPEFAPELPLEPLRWVVGVGSQLDDRLQDHHQHLAKRIENARFVRAGTSDYAIDDIAVLDRIAERSAHAGLQLQSAVKSIVRRVGRRISPLYVTPRALPRTRAWQRFRRQAAQFSRPQVTLVPWLKELLQDMVSMADVPFLYQRWCGLQIVFAANRLGWQTNGDVVGALFLGGLIEFRRDGHLVELWVEPRLSAVQARRVGWRSERNSDLTPDFLFVTGESGNRDAFVLDATLSTDGEHLASKRRYRDMLIGEDMRLVAGIPVARRPARSWAAAPIKAEYCRLGDSQGIGGVVPVDPTGNTFTGLEAWMGDIFLHARQPGSAGQL